MHKAPVAVISSYGPSLNATLECLRLAGIDSVVYNPRMGLNKSRVVLGNCSHVIVKGHSSNYPLMMKLRLSFRGKIINHWQGSDVFNSFNNPKRLTRIKIAQLFVRQNWVVGKRLLEPLLRLGIQSKIVPHRVFETKHGSLKRPTKGILVYIPASSGRENIGPNDLYGIDKAVELSKRLPDFTFHFVGGGIVPEQIRSCISYGYLHNLMGLWDKVDYYFRVTLSDGMPKMILEAAENGVLPVSDYEYFDGMYIYKDADEIARKIRSYEGYQESLTRIQKDIAKIYAPQVVIASYHSNLASG